MPIEIRELIVRARVEPDSDRAAQPATQPKAATILPRSVDEDELSQMLRDMKER